MHEQLGLRSDQGTTIQMGPQRRSFMMSLNHRAREGGDGICQRQRLHSPQRERIGLLPNQGGLARSSTLSGAQLSARPFRWKAKVGSVITHRKDLDKTEAKCR